MSKNRYHNFLNTEKIKKVLRPRFSFHYISYAILISFIAFSVVGIVTATTPNPGHPWAEVGDGVFAVTNNQTATRTYTFPDANATVLTTANLVTIAQGGTNASSFTGNGVVVANSGGTALTTVINATGSTLCLTQVSSGTPTWGTCGGVTDGDKGDITVSGSGTIWSIDSGAVLLNELGAAGATNTINNGNFAQEWQWNTLAGNTGLKLSSNSTAAASNTQKLFEVALSGLNSTAGQTTYSGSFSNTHTGSGTNVGLYATASGGSNNYAVHSDGTLRLVDVDIQRIGTNSVSIGGSAPSVSYSLLFGTTAGLNSTSANYSNFLGYRAGNNAANASQSNFLGREAGYTASGASNSNFFGYQAGYGATNASNSNFFGQLAGSAATDAIYSNFLGYGAGGDAPSSSYSNFFGYNAGNFASSSSYANFLGYQAGGGSSSYSNIIGYQAGLYASSAYSNLFGYQAGKWFTGNSIGSNNIIIGTNISLPNTTANAINIGGVLFGTGTYSTTTGNPSITAVSTGKIGIGTASPAYRLDVLNANTAQTASNRVANFSNAGATFDTTAGNLSSYGGYFSSTSTESAGGNVLTNVGLYATASSADNNYAAIFDAGNVGVGTTTPASKLRVVGTNNSWSNAVGYFETSAAVGTEATVLRAMAPNMTAGKMGMIMGKDDSAYNELLLQYNHVGNNSSSNYFNISFYGAADRFTVNGLGNGTFAGNLDVAGSLTAGTADAFQVNASGNILGVFANETTDVDKFLVSNAGTIKYRTGAELLSDIGGVGGTGATNQLTYWSGTSTITAGPSFIIAEALYPTLTIGRGVGYGDGALLLKDAGGTTASISNPYTGLTLTPSSTYPLINLNGRTAAGTNNTTGADLAITNTGVYTGTGIFNLTANSATTGTLASISSTGLTAGKLLDLFSDGTNASNNQTGLNISLTGANAVSGTSTFGSKITNTHSGTTSTNYGLWLSANSSVDTYGVYSQVSGISNSMAVFASATSATTNYGVYANASGGTNNYAIVAAAGNVGIGDTTPSALLSVGSGDLFQVDSSGRVFANVGASGAGNLAYSFVGDTNTGIYQGGADIFKIQTAGSDRFVIDASGNVTIPDLASAGTQCVQASSTGELSVTGSACGAGGATAWSDITVPTGNLTLAMDADTTTFNYDTLTTGTAFKLASSSISSGTLLDLTATGTAATNGQKGLNVALTGALTGAQTTYGGYFSNTRTGASAVNVGLYSTASGATGANYAAIFDAGNVGVGTISPTLTLDTRGTAGVMGTGTTYPTAVNLNNPGTFYVVHPNNNQGLVIANPVNSSASPTLTFYKTRGVDAGTKTAVQVGDRLGNIGFFGVSTDGSADLGVRILAEAESVNTSSVGGRLVFSSFNTSGVFGERMRLTADGNLNIGGNTSPTGMFSVGSTSQFQVNSSGNILGVFANATTDTDQFLVSDSGTIKYRTGAEILSDIGAQASGNYITALTGDITATGPGSVAATIANDVVDWADIIDSMTVDAATDINLGANALSIDLDSTGDFSIRDVTTDIATFADSGAITFAPTSGQNLAINLAGVGRMEVTGAANTLPIVISGPTSDGEYGGLGFSAYATPGTLKSAIVKYRTSSYGIGDLVFLNDATVDASSADMSDERMRIASSGNIGIGGDTTPNALFSVGSTSQFQVNTSGAIAAAAGIISSGTIQFSSLTTNGALYTSGGNGTLTTTAPTSGALGYWSRATTTLSPTTANDIVSIANTTTTGADLAITNTGVYTGTGVFNLTANSATSGTLASITGNGLTSGSLLSLTGTRGANAPTAGLFKSVATVNSSAVGVNANNIYIETNNTNTTNTNTVYGINNVLNDNTNLDNTISGINNIISISGSGLKSISGIATDISSSSTGAEEIFGTVSSASATGAVASGAQSIYGFYGGADTSNVNGGTSNVYGVFASSGGTVTSGTINSYGVYVGGGTAMNTTGTSTKYGLYVENQTGADNNYAAVFAGGNVGIGTTTPTFSLDIQRTAANLNVQSTTGTNAAYTQYNNTGGNMFVGRENSAGNNMVTGAAAYSGVVNVVGAYPLHLAANNTIGLTINSSGYLVAPSLDTDLTAPSTTGTTKMVISDSNGLISFTNIPTGGSGTVTNTGGALTLNSVVLGAGTVDTKVSTGITTDGTAGLILGVNTTTLGTLKMFGNTSGDVTLQPTAAAGTATVQTLPATTGTLVNRVTTANGVSASNTDGALSFTLGAITPTTVNGLTLTSNATGFSIAGGTTSKTLTLSNSLTLAGTDSTTMTFPSTSATIARTDAGQTFTGVQTFSSAPTFSSITGSTQCLQVNSSGVVSGTGSACGAGGGGLTVGTSAITSGGANRVLFENGSNVLSESANFTYDGTTLGVATSSTTASNKALNITQTGATSGTDYAGYFSNTGGATTNVGLYTTASGGTTNLALNVDQGQTLLGGTTLSTGTLAKLNIVSTLSTGAASSTDIAGIHGDYTFTNGGSSGFVQVGNRFVFNNTPTTNSNTMVGESIRILDSSGLANLVRGIDIVANAGSNTSGTNTGLRSTGATFGVQAITSGGAGGVSLPAGLYAENTGTTQGNVARFYTGSMTSAPSMLNVYHDTSTFTGTGLLMDMAVSSGTFSGNFTEFKNASVTKFKVTSAGVVSMGLSGTASTNAVCSSLANGSAPTAGTAYEIRDCNAAPAADYAEMYPVESGVEFGDIVSTGTEIVNTYDTTNGNIDWTKVKGKVTRLVKSNRSYQGNVIGIVADNFGDFTSAGHNIKDSDNPMPVALNGRVPVKISSSSPSIEPGDYITTSNEQGKATKATKGGFVIGKALEAWSPNQGVSTLMVYVEQGFYDGQSLSVFAGLSTESNVFAREILHKFLSNQQENDSTSEILLDRLAAGVEIITPRIVTDEAVLNTITSESGGDISLVIGSSGKLAIKTNLTSQTPAIVFDSLGNATFSGTISAKDIKIGDISGIEQITNQINNLSEGQQAFTLTTQVMSTLAQALSLAQADILKLQTDLTNTQTTIAGLTTIGVESDRRLKIIESFLAQDADGNVIGFNINTLNVSGDSAFAGRAQFDGLSFFSNTTSFAGGVSFGGQTEFALPPLYNKDSAGYALIKQGDRKVQITFNQAYIATPVVNTSITFESEDNIDDMTANTLFNDDVRFIIIGKSQNGFTILLNKQAPRDIRFSWNALSVKEPAVFESVFEGLIIEQTPNEIPNETQTDIPSQQPIETSNESNNNIQTPNESPIETVPTNESGNTNIVPTQNENQNQIQEQVSEQVI